jgi:hypothetical protein
MAGVSTGVVVARACRAAGARSCVQAPAPMSASESMRRDDGGKIGIDRGGGRSQTNRRAAPQRMVAGARIAR